MKKCMLILLIPYVLSAFESNDSISTKSYKADEVIVIDDKFDVNEKNAIKVLSSTDDLLKYNNSVDLIRRANFASEPMIRGFSQKRLNVTIDGMRMFSACTDKMDPITSYIEVENIKSSEVSADKTDMSNGTSIGGSLNFITNKPIFGNHFGIVLDNRYSSASEFYNSKGKASFSEDNYSLLASYSIKNANDYKAGNYTLINNSGYKKENVKFNLSNQLNENNTQGLEYIYDHSADVGFPSLIMDTRNTEMHLLSYQLDFKNLSDNIIDWDSKVYYNYISHLMDDFDRSNEEIENRAIMPGMHMPMFGTTQTIGLVSKGKLLMGNNVLNLSAEIYNMKAFADMKMELLDTHQKMYLINLGDIQTYSGGLSAAYITQVNEATLLKFNGRIDYTTRRVTNDFAKAITESYWGNNYSTQSIAFNTSMDLNYQLMDSQSLDFALSRVERVPTHLESFAFYIYNISDNSIYIGNPNLSKEKSYSINLGYNYSKDGVKLHFNLYNNYLVDYIAGLPNNEIEVNDNFAQSFKVYENIGNANVVGFETSLDYSINNNFGFLAKLKYQYSRSFKFNESLPFTPPLSGMINLSYNNEDYIGVVSAEFANSQNNISKHITLEDDTPGYVILSWRNNYKISEPFTIRFGVENIFNKYYYTHFSINNLPNQGRNFYLGLVVNI